MDVIRRTFEAAKHPRGSEERARLNRDAITSEYMPSYRYLTSDGRSWRTKGEAQAYVAQSPATGCAIHPITANPFCDTCREHGNPHPFDRAEEGHR